MDGPVLTHLDARRLDLGPTRGMPPEGNWRAATDADGIGWLVLDKADSGANTISQAVIRELSEHIDRVAEDPPAALVIRSAKPGGFALGAEIDEIAAMDEDGAKALLRDAHSVLDRIEALPVPTVAAVHGPALGAGFELALACDFRIAIPGASFGFPEVRLGLHPGLGGTFRLTERIDPLEAMTLMLTGKSAHTDKALALGIADTVVEERHLQGALRAVVSGKIDHAGRSLTAEAFRTRAVRGLAADRMRRQTAKQAPEEHYPAPYALIELWLEHGADRDAMRDAEIASFAHLLSTDTHRNLLRVFHLRQRLKRGGRGESSLDHVHVIGAGAMGGDIAAWAALNGKRVTLEDLDHDAIGTAIRDARETCKSAHLDDLATRDALDRLMPDPAGYGRARADLVIEAVPEVPEVKEKLYGSLTLRPGAILATNTSSLPLDELSGDAPDAGRFAGLHFFNPVPRMQCVEVVRHAGTDPETIDRLMAFCGEIDRLPVAVTDHPGFLVNRALTPYLLEAMALLDEGVEKEAIDGAALAFGMPVGPLMLADQVGLDICLHVAESLHTGLDKPLVRIPDWLRDKVEAGDTGKKAGRGLYDWSGDGPSPDPVEDAARADRLILPMLDACVECLRRGVVRDADDLDAAMIFATGFAPFRGGPLHHAKARGVEDVVTRLQGLRAEHGDRFAPDPGWGRLA